MNWEFGNIYYLFLLILIPVLGITLSRYAVWKQKKKALFADEKFHQNLFQKNRFFSKLFPVLYLLAVSFLLFSIVDLLTGSEEIETKQKVNNVIFLMDVSNSMNAEDIQPNRLTEAKNIVINKMNQMKNDRVGIVMFAGTATSVMPLTTDYTAAETYLEGIETSAIKVQGTDFLKAMEVTAKKFQHISKGSRKVILISDGEDNEGNEEAAINLAKREGITVFTVGVGTEQGGPIPEYVYGQLMGYKNDLSEETVISKRQTEALKDIAHATGGKYIDGNQLHKAVTSIINEINSSSSSTVQKVKSFNGIHYYQYPLTIAFALFILIFLFNPKRDFNF